MRICVQKENGLKVLKPNMESIKIYKKKLLEVKSQESELNGIILQMTEVKEALELSKKLRLNEFMEGFNLITLKLKEMYRVSLFCFFIYN